MASEPNEIDVFVELGFNVFGVDDEGVFHLTHKWEYTEDTNHKVRHCPECGVTEVKCRLMVGDERFNR